jgi:hypothetical protein
VIALWVGIGVWLLIAFVYFMTDPSWETLAIGLLLPFICVLAIVEAVFG